MTLSAPRPYLDQLRDLGQMPDHAISPGDTLILLASRAHPGISVSRFSHHLEKLALLTGKAFDALIKDGADKEEPETKRTALERALWEKENYRPDPRPGHLENLDMMRVIDRRCGHPQALAVLYLHAARGCGWDARLLGLPSHFVLRLQDGAKTILCDPADHCRTLEAVDLRRMVKTILGEDAELASAYYTPLTNREILIRMQNYKKLRQIEQEDYKGALDTISELQLIAPDEYRLLLDEGVLRDRLNDTERAIAALRRYIDKTPDYREKQDALLLIQHIYDSRSS